jgi:hypothetical protein
MVLTKETKCTLIQLVSWIPKHGPGAHLKSMESHLPEDLMHLVHF